MKNDDIEKLIRLFLRFPGIGERQARRFAYFITTEQMSYVQALSHLLVSVRNQSKTCKECLRVFDGEVENSLCEICRDPNRESETIVVLEKNQDVEAFMRTEYKGKFFILGGLIPIIQKNVLDGTNIKILEQKIKNDNSIKELILAFPLTPNGDHTDQVLREILSPLNQNLKITSLGRGLSTGAELEYVDPASLSASLKKRE